MEQTKAWTSLWLRIPIPFDRSPIGALGIGQKIKIKNPIPKAPLGLRSPGSETLAKDYSRQLPPRRFRILDRVPKDFAQAISPPMPKGPSMVVIVVCEDMAQGILIPYHFQPILHSRFGPGSSYTVFGVLLA